MVNGTDALTGCRWDAGEAGAARRCRVLSIEELLVCVTSLRQCIEPVQSVILLFPGVEITGTRPGTVAKRVHRNDTVTGAGGTIEVHRGLSPHPSGQALRGLGTGDRHQLFTFSPGWKLAADESDREPADSPQSFAEIRT
jgi:hypothetical protein